MSLPCWPPRFVTELERIHPLWNGNFYALSVTHRLGLEEKGGLVRAGLTHYNTQAEINKLVTAMLAANTNIRLA